MIIYELSEEEAAHFQRYIDKYNLKYSEPDLSSDELKYMDLFIRKYNEQTLEDEKTERFNKIFKGISKWDSFKQKFV